jgi:hypothetical protein
MKTKLKPCPFCGAMGELIDFGDLASINCSVCEVELCITGPAHDLIKKWNRRTETEKDEKIRRMESQILSMARELSK